MADRDKRADDDELEAGDKKPSKGSSSLLMVVVVVIGIVLLVLITAVSTAVVMHMMSPVSAEEAVDDTDQSVDKAADKKGKKEKKTKKKEKDKEKAPDTTAYLPLDPAFIVNFEQGGRARFLQASMEVMTKDPLVIEDVKKHMPAIRNALVFLLSGQKYEALSTNEGKEKIRTDALAAVQKILHENTGKPGIEAIYFTNFVMQ